MSVPPYLSRREFEGESSARRGFISDASGWARTGRERLMRGTPSPFGGSYRSYDLVPRPPPGTFAQLLVEVADGGTMPAALRSPFGRDALRRSISGDAWNRDSAGSPTPEKRSASLAAGQDRDERTPLFRVTCQNRVPAALTTNRLTRERNPR